MGKVDDAAASRLIQIGESSDRTLPSLLSQLGLVNDHDVAIALSKLLGLPLLKPEELPNSAVLPEQLSARFLRERRALPIKANDNAVIVAMADPLDHFCKTAIETAVRRPIEIRIAEPGFIERSIIALYSVTDGIDHADPADTGASQSELNEDQLRDLASEAPVVRFVNRTISDAVEIHASDIHIEPFEGKIEVRYRIDGSLVPQEAPPRQWFAAIVSRIKIMANLDITERRLPQDGRAQAITHGKRIDLRISTMPTVFGESVVIRVLDRDNVALDFGSLGIQKKNLTTLERLLTKPNGILLVTGPTGSGKSTTLYAALQSLNGSDKKILTVEDPVEYQLKGINQVPAKPSIGLTFAHVLRSMLRQDPDILMVGEIRDQETASIAVQAALTGHLVLSSLHTNDAASSITRLQDMGIEDFLLSATIIGSIAQRLVRKLCSSCKVPNGNFPASLSDLVEEKSANLGSKLLYTAVGCPECSYTGYSGRTAILEILTLSDTLRSKIAGQCDAESIRRQAVQEGMHPIIEDGLEKALAGETSIEEVLRVIRDS